jgi:phage host-nuclease inhibitor protein Gam
MKNKNNELATKKEMQQGFTEIKQEIKELGAFMKEGFTVLDQKIGNVEKHLTDRIDNLENKMDRRISVTEDRVRVVKDVIEKDLKTKVAW